MSDIAPFVWTRPSVDDALTDPHALADAVRAFQARITARVQELAYVWPFGIDVSYGVHENGRVIVASFTPRPAPLIPRQELGL